MPESLDELRADLRSGDPEAYRKLVRDLSEPLFRYVRPMLKDDAGAQDVVQQTFLRVFKSRRRLKRQGSIRTFCFFIATNLVRDSKRRQATRRRHEAEAAEMQRSTEPDHAETINAKEAFELAMELPIELREVVLLKIAQGFTAAETAEMLGIPEGTVKTRQRTALEKLRARLLSVGAAPAPGLDELEFSLSEGAKTSVTVPTSLVTNVEALVMANVGTQTGMTIAILAGVFALLLLGAGVAVGATYFVGGGDNVSVEPIAMENDATPIRGDQDSGELLIEGDETGDDSGDTDDAGKSDPSSEGTDANDTVSEDTSNQVRFSIRGRVIDQEDKPVAGAYVYIDDSSPRENLKWRFNAMTRSGVAMLDDYYVPEFDSVNEEATSGTGLTFPEPPGGVYSDAGGYFELSVLAQANSEEVYFSLDVFAVGYSGGSRSIFTSIKDKDVIEQTLSVRAHDRYLTFSTRPPVAEALRVEVSSKVGSMSAVSTLSSEPGPDGIHQVELDSDIVSTLGFKAHGYVAVETSVRDAGARHVEAGEFELSKGASVQGQVVNEDGEPVAGAVMRLDDTFDSYAVTGPEGEFAIEGVSSVPLPLAIRHRDYASTSLSVQPGDKPMRIELTRGVSVEGLVRFQGLATPESTDEVRIVLVRKSDAEKMRDFQYQDLPGVDISETHAFRFERIAPGDYVARGVMGRHEGKLSVPVAVHVEDQDVSIEIVFGAGGTVSGLVIAPDGSPLVDAKISLIDFADGLGGRELRGETDAQGRYLFEDVEPGRYIVLLMDHDTDMSEGLFARRTVEVGEGSVTFDIDLGAKIPGNVVRGQLTLDGQFYFRDVFVLGTGLDTGIWRSKLDAEGRFNISGIPPGDYYFYAGGRSNQTIFRLPISFDGWDGEQVIERSLAGADLTIQFRSDGPETPRVGMTLRPLFEPVFGRDMLLSMMQSESSVDEDGKAELTGLITGRYLVTAIAPGHATFSRVVDLTGDTTLEFVLTQECGDAEFEFELDDSFDDVPEHNRYAVARLYAADQSGLPALYFEMLALKDGASAQLPALAPGRYRLEITGPVSVPLTREFEVKAGEQASIKLQPKLGARVTLEISDESVPMDVIQSASIRVTDAAGNTVRFEGIANPLFMGGGQPQPDRKLRVGPLKAGSYIVNISARGYRPVSIEVNVAEGEQKVLPLQLERE